VLISKPVQIKKRLKIINKKVLDKLIRIQTRYKKYYYSKFSHVITQSKEMYGKPEQTNGLYKKKFKYCYLHETRILVRAIRNFLRTRSRKNIFEIKKLIKPEVYEKINPLDPEACRKCWKDCNTVQEVCIIE